MFPDKDYNMIQGWHRKNEKVLPVLYSTRKIFDNITRKNTSNRPKKSPADKCLQEYILLWWHTRLDFRDSQGGNNTRFAVAAGNNILMVLDI